MENEKYITIIGDLVESRKLPERSKVQIQIDYFLIKLNSKFLDSIVSGFTTTVNDEFQGLLNRTFPLEHFVWFFQEQVGQKFQMRFGIGLGDLTTAVREEAIGMDGSCFRHARKALERAKKNAKFIAFEGFEMNVALSSLFDFVYELNRRWTTRQKEIITRYRQKGSQSAVAKELGITKQSVFDALKGAKYEKYRNGWDGIHQLMQFSI